MPLIKLLQEEEVRYAEAVNSRQKLNHINNIIQLKMKLPGFDKRLIYADLKHYINHAISCTDTEMYEYDQVNEEALCRLVGHLDLNQQVECYRYLLRRVKLSNMADKEQWALSLFKKSELKFLFFEGWHQYSFFYNIYKILVAMICYSILTLCSGFIISYIVVYVLLLPAKFKLAEAFSVKYTKYFDNYYYNHGANVLSLFLNLKSDFEVKPINGLGFGLIAAGKLFVIVIVANFAMKQIEKRMNS